jgi:hypothetical protein
MGERNGTRNGRPSPHERREELVREDRQLKREVDDALQEWDRLLEADSNHATDAAPAPAAAKRAS